jgi:hypothetical protein
VRGERTFNELAVAGEGEYPFQAGETLQNRTLSA